MKHRYGDHPTQKEIFAQVKSPMKAEDIWQAESQERIKKSQRIELKGKASKNFWYVTTPYLLDLIARISEEKGFLDALSLSASKKIVLSKKARNYEAYYSSRIEGARSTLEEALKFIKKKRRYSEDESLQMIGNNQRALEYIDKNSEGPITHDLICTLQEILTDNTHKDHPIVRGKYREGPVYVVNGTGQIVYEGPPAKKVRSMMDNFIRWIQDSQIINPLIKAGIVHLYFVHVHPFDDGNGRTARAVSNLFLANAGYKFINLLSLSSYFDHKRPSYYRAISDVDEHDYDLTYFLIFYLEALISKILEMKKEITLDSKVKDIKETISQDNYAKLNRRQIKALRSMLRKTETMTTRKYCKMNKCSDETARKDFNELLDMALIEATGSGRSREYKLSGKIGNGNS